jgi:RNA polymerase sigma-70 factor (ECF subfamily)
LNGGRELLEEVFFLIGQTGGREALPTVRKFLPVIESRDKSLVQRLLGCIAALAGPDDVALIPFLLEKATDPEYSRIALRGLWRIHRPTAAAVLPSVARSLLSTQENASLLLAQTLALLLPTLPEREQVEFVNEVGSALRRKESAEETVALVKVLNQTPGISPHALQAAQLWKRKRDRAGALLVSEEASVSEAGFTRATGFRKQIPDEVQRAPLPPQPGDLPARKVGGSDEFLVEQFKATRDSSYFEALVRRHAQRILSVCRKMLNSDSLAEEITQDTFTRASLQIDSFHGGPFFRWLWGFARNGCINHLKSGATRERNAPLESTTVQGDAAAADVERAEHIRKLLDELDPPQRMVLRLFFWEGYSYNEVAATAGIPVREVKSRLENGRRRFRLLWEKAL